MFKFKTYAKAEVVTDKEGVLKKALAGQVDMPKDAPFDLLFFKAVYLTSGVNLNYTCFDKGELQASINTVANKAMDIEHEESGIVGHIYTASFFKAGSSTPIEVADVNNCDGPVDVVIAGVVYKDRFPELASEIAKGEWYVSMETYYESFDVVVGSMVLDSETADSLGITSLIGQEVTLKKEDKVVANGVVSRLVKNLHFSGGGFVKTPANPTSVILDTSDSSVIDISVLSASTENDDLVIDDKVDFDKVLNEAKILVKNMAEKKLNACSSCGDLLKELDAAMSMVSDSLNKELAAKWTTKYINSLPNSAFIIIEPAYTKGTTDNKSARHLPYKNKEGKVDLPHLRNALARCNQIKPVTDSITKESLRSKACSKAQKLAKKHLKKKK